MKKLFLTLAAVVMSFTAMTTIASAANQVYYEEVSKTDTTVTVALRAVTDYGTNFDTFQIIGDLSEAVENGLVMEKIVIEEDGDTMYGPVAKSDSKMSLSLVATGVRPRNLAEDTNLGLVTFDVSTLTKDFVLAPVEVKVVFKGDATVYTDKFEVVPYTLKAGATQEPVIERGSETFVATATDADGYTGVKFNFSTDYTEAPEKTGSATVAFGMALENGSAVVALTVNDIIKTVDGAAVAFNCTGVELYK